MSFLNLGVRTGRRLSVHFGRTYFLNLGVKGFCFVVPQTVNAVLILVMIPVFQTAVYPALRKCKLLTRYSEPSPPRDSFTVPSDTPWKYKFDVISVGQRWSPWPGSLVKVEIN